MVVALDGLIESAQVVIAKAQGVVGAHHRGIQLDDPLQAGDGGGVILGIIIEPRQPIEVERILRLGRRKLGQFRARPIAAVELDIGHGQGEPAAIVKRSNGFGLFPGDGGIQVLAVQKENSSGDHE